MNRNDRSTLYTGRIHASYTTHTGRMGGLKQPEVRFIQGVYMPYTRRIQDAWVDLKRLKICIPVLQTVIAIAGSPEAAEAQVETLALVV